MNIQLIKGNYDSKEAFELISRLVQVKIDFHEKQIASGQSEEDIKMRERRIKELQDELMQARERLGAEHQRINLEGSIHLN